jgi:tetratricopeptide (TPR) repeat protein
VNALVALCVTSALLVGPPTAESSGLEPATASESSPQQRGEAAFAEQRWDDAAEAFAEAYAADPDPRFLYAQAQAVRKAGDCRRAIELYAEFLETGPPEAAERGARDNMAECAQEVAAEPAPVAQVEPEPVVEAEPQSEPPRSEDRDRRWYADPWGGALAGIAVAGLAAGGITYGLAKTDERAANRATTEVEYLDKIDRAAPLSRAGIVLFAIGGAALVGAVVRYAIVGARSKRERERVTASRGGLVVRF